MTMFVMTACSSASPTAVQPMATTSVKVPAATVVDQGEVALSPLTISFRGMVIARLFADGRTESAGSNAPGGALVPGPTLHADGTIVMSKGGITARIDHHGEIYVVGPAGANPPEQLFGRISGDQFTFAGSARPWDVRVHGNLIEFGDQNSSQIDGDVTPSMRHAALVMAAAFYVETALAAP
jgi:hypothetical protein